MVEQRIKELVEKLRKQMFRVEQNSNRIQCLRFLPDGKLWGYKLSLQELEFGGAPPEVIVKNIAYLFNDAVYKILDELK